MKPEHRQVNHIATGLTNLGLDKEWESRVRSSLLTLNKLPRRELESIHQEHQADELIQDFLTHVLGLMSTLRR